MTDLEKVKRCAERMGVEVEANNQRWFLANVVGPRGHRLDYNPLTNKAQAFELVEKLELQISPHYVGDNNPRGYAWGVRRKGGYSVNADLCRAIVECVSQMPSKGHG